MARPHAARGGPEVGPVPGEGLRLVVAIFEDDHQRVPIHLARYRRLNASRLLTRLLTGSLVRAGTGGYWRGRRPPKPKVEWASLALDATRRDEGSHNPKVVGSNPTPATIESAGERPRRVRGLPLSWCRSTGTSTGEKPVEERGLRAVQRRSARLRPACRAGCAGRSPW